MDDVRNIVRESNELSKKGEYQKALELLDCAIAGAVQENRRAWVAVLSGHASTIADQLGDLRLVRQYREQRLAHDPDNPLALSSLASVLHQQGESKLAKEYALKSYRISAQRDTKLDRALVESLLHTWPDLPQIQS